MADTTYIDFQAPAVNAAWLNDVNKNIYDTQTAPAGTLKASLLSDTDATKGAALVGFDGELTYPVGSVGWALQQGGVRLEWFYVSTDGNDYLPAFNRAVTFLAALTGPQYADSMGQAPYGYGVSRGIHLAGKKYPISNTLTLSADIGIYADGGGFYALPTFPAGAYMLDTGANPYGGRVESLTLDGSDLNVKGVRIQNAHNTRWHGLSVVSCRNDGITYQSGAEFYLTDFEVSGSGSPNSVSVAGLRVLGSDAGFSNGVVKYTPIGVYSSGGGNCEFTGIHAWGLYAAFKQYVSFWFVNSVRNTITACYGDSPTKQDYAQDNLIVLNGIPNGGVCFYLDATSNQNVLQGCRGYVNTTAYAAAGLPGTNQFYDVYTAAQFTNVFGLVHNYAGNWAGDVRFASDTVRDNCLVVGSPNTPNGTFPAVLGIRRTNAGGTVRLPVINSDTTANANSTAQIAYNINNTDIAADVAVYSTGTAPYLSRQILGVEKFRTTTRGLEATGGSVILKSAPISVSAGEISLGNATATVVGAAGGAAALPATPLGYMTAFVGGVPVKFPYYNN